MTRFKPRPESERPPASETLDTLYRRYSAWLVARLRGRFNGVEAEDLAQEAFVRVARIELEDIRHPKALLLKVATNVGLTHAKRESARARVANLAVDHDAAGIDVPSPSDQDAQLLLKEIVLTLPPLYRDVFLLSRFAGMTYESISDHLGISVATVERRLARAVALCAEQLRD